MRERGTKRKKRTKRKHNKTVYYFYMNGCPYCEKVKELMRLTKQHYVVYTLDEHFTIENFEEEFNTRTFPQIVVDNSNQRKHIGGAAELAQYFKEKSLPK